MLNDNTPKPDQPEEQQPVASDRELESCHVQLADLHDKYIRLNADFKNFKDRVIRERAEQSRQTQADVWADLLPIIDNFERALTDMPVVADNQPLTAWLIGLQLIGKQTTTLFAKYGIAEIDCAGPFNPALHEAVAHVESNSHQPGHIVHVARKGYLIRDTLLRPAQVIVAK